MKITNQQLQKNPQFHGKNKHILFEKKWLKILLNWNIADMLTKALNIQQFTK